ncbi:hypothetical protein POX_d05992 [Penicillium oxalicum]|uniref:Uncharacterized protein n=1 Tax=Penicillium oxalicum (strain 114-2 / CGMCC 5302) TaxID=933388 RepID=S7ZME1_PENO1|nr:hypothetical protein POX_d05992 [Penicillium oxalicum]EPS31815.1 hypothetical protein PDE_06773 [Penicillium oxalicum 114-2]KAI2790476.1 hypothetical protein POX_d05992 [Penicillium oxalicum]
MLSRFFVSVFSKMLCFGTSTTHSRLGRGCANLVMAAETDAGRKGLTSVGFGNAADSGHDPASSREVGRIFGIGSDGDGKVHGNIDGCPNYAGCHSGPFASLFPFLFFFFTCYAPTRYRRRCSAIDELIQYPSVFFFFP